VMFVAKERTEQNTSAVFIFILLAKQNKMEYFLA
jgi:hypothetical protein